MAKLVYAETKKLVDMIKSQLKKDKFDIPIYREGELKPDFKPPYLVYRDSQIILEHFLDIEGCFEGRFNVTFYGEYDRWGEPKQGLDSAVRGLRNEFESFRIGNYKVILRACNWLREDGPNRFDPNDQVTIVDFVFGFYPDIQTESAIEDVADRDARLEQEKDQKKKFEEQDGGKGKKPTKDGGK